MAANNALKFYKGWYGSGSHRNLPNEPKAIIFNETEGVIYVNGKGYGGANDINFENGVLTISYSDGRNNITLDFNDTASASATLKVFDRINNLIGENVNIANSDGKLNYANTNYLEEAETLVEADRTLDLIVKALEGSIENLNVEIYSSGSEEEPVVVSVKQESGLITGVDVIPLGANITFENGVFSVENNNGMVLGSDVTAIKDYVDSKAKSSVEVINSNGNDDALVVESFEENGKQKFDVNLFWSEFGGETSDSDSDSDN